MLAIKSGEHTAGRHEIIWCLRQSIEEVKKLVFQTSRFLKRAL
jgi:hypothetical protein